MWLFVTILYFLVIFLFLFFLLFFFPSLLIFCTPSILSQCVLSPAATWPPLHLLSFFFLLLLFPSTQHWVALLASWLLHAGEQSHCPNALPNAGDWPHTPLPPLPLVSLSVCHLQLNLIPLDSILRPPSWGTNPLRWILLDFWWILTQIETFIFGEFLRFVPCSCNFGNYLVKLTICWQLSTLSK